MNHDAKKDTIPHLIPRPEQCETLEEYTSPKLTEFGTIRKLTLGSSGSCCFFEAK